MRTLGKAEAPALPPVGIAQALKQACIHFAAGVGYRELVTWTQMGNDAMQAVNLGAGFRPGHVSITVEGPLL